MTKPINITIIAGLIIVAGLGVYFAKYRVANAPITSPDTNIVGDDKDEHSCIGSAGYSWCGEKDECLRVFEELCPDVITSLIAELKTETDISLTKVGDLQLTWNVREGNNFASEAIPDISYKNSDVTFSNYQKIEKFMKSKFLGRSFRISVVIAKSMHRCLKNRWQRCNSRMCHLAIRRTD